MDAKTQGHVLHDEDAMHGQDEPLEVPEFVKTAGTSTEVLRVWFAEGKTICALRSTISDDPAVWGILLAQIVHHVADAFAKAGGDRDQVMKRVEAGFRVELDNVDPSLGELRE